jgi:hypothetical protein
VAGLTTRRAFVIAASAGAAGAALAATIGRHERPKPRLATRLAAARYDGDVPSDDPGSDAWYTTEPILVRLQPQQIATPFLQEAAIDQLTVEALHNGEEIAFRLGWKDESADDLPGIASFQDAVALQLPILAGVTPPAITMGGAGAPVHILQWRASWQRDLRRRTSVEDLYPHLVRDVTADDVLGAAGALPYYPGRAVRNPLSAETRTTPVEEIVAEGFGSVTTLAEQRARGAGVHEDGSWSVTIGLPLDRGESFARLEPGSSWPVAFALWLGSQGNRGARKHFADWVECRLER